MAGTPEWLAEQMALARSDGDWQADDAEMARRHLRRRANILDWFQVAALVVGTVAIVTLAVAYFGVSGRADRLVHSNDRLVKSYADLAKVADDLRKLAAASTPEEREAARRQVQADAGILTPTTTTPATVTSPATTSATTTTIRSAPPTTATPASTTTTTQPSGSTTTTTVCTVTVPVAGCVR